MISAGVESWTSLPIEVEQPLVTFKIETMADVRRFVAERHDPRFILPARFRDASFASFEVATGFPQHRRLRDELRDFVNQANPTPKRFWRRSAVSGTGEGRFLVGPPGVGKTHLLAAAYRAGTEPKLFATFDELVAAAGPLGMSRLSALLGAAQLVCIDEIVLEDPANIMMLATLLGILIETNTRIVATANMPPDEAGGQGGWVRSFERELGQIAAAFKIERIDGRDRRLDPPDAGSANDLGSGDVLTASWREIEAYLIDTHPMHDAAWLDLIAAIRIEGEIQPPLDNDRALRFVRFIDRVYDRAVRLETMQPSCTPEDLLGPLNGDPRYIWHVARGTSRLTALMGDSRPTNQSHDRRQVLTEPTSE